VTIDGRPIDGGHLAWDGRVLWLDVTIEARSEVCVRFDGQRER
jgi:hypothetical protein